MLALCAKFRILTPYLVDAATEIVRVETSGRLRVAAIYYLSSENPKSNYHDMLNAIARDSSSPLQAAAVKYVLQLRCYDLDTKLKLSMNALESNRRPVRISVIRSVKSILECDGLVDDFKSNLISKVPQSNFGSLIRQFENIQLDTDEVDLIGRRIQDFEGVGAVFQFRIAFTSLLRNDFHIPKDQLVRDLLQIKRKAKSAFVRESAEATLKAMAKGLAERMSKITELERRLFLSVD